MRDYTDDELRIIEQAKIILERKTTDLDVMTSTAVCKDYLIIKLSDKQTESFYCLFLDTKNRLIAFERMEKGTLREARVYPREIAKRALHHNAASVIFAHNHPSGDPEPSASDINLTQKLKETLVQLDINVLDHIIIGSGKSISLAERRRI